MTEHSLNTFLGGENTQLDYEIIATGSSGNAVRIENIMIDCGVPFKSMHEALYKCNTLLITHRHQDHVNDSTLARINKSFPRIETYANADVAYRHHVNHVISEKPFVVKHKDRKITITPKIGVHDVDVAYFVIQIGDTNIIYSTDNVYLDAGGIKFDYLFLESNYDETKLTALAKQYAKRGYDPIANSVRHMSTQKAKEFYFVNRRNRDSVLVELHQSSRFY